MVLDEYDLKILKAFDKLCNKENVSLSSWKSMKKIFPEGDDRENKKVVYRIKKMEQFGLFCINKNHNKEEWIMNRNHVKFRYYKFPDTKANAILLKINNLWEIHQLY